MKWFAAAVLVAIEIITLAAAPRNPLSQRYSKWLNEDVVYIITDEERKAFLGLAADEQRDRFIENFWDIRNPAPVQLATPTRTNTTSGSNTSMLISAVKSTRPAG